MTSCCVYPTPVRNASVIHISNNKHIYPVIARGSVSSRVYPPTPVRNASVINISQWGSIYASVIERTHVTLYEVSTRKTNSTTTRDDGPTDVRTYCTCTCQLSYSRSTVQQEALHCIRTAILYVGADHVLRGGGCASALTPGRGLSGSSRMPNT